MLDRRREIEGILLAVLSATIFGTHPTLVHFLRSGGMGITPTLFTGSIQGLAIYSLVLLVTKKLDTIHITKGQFFRLVLCSILFYSTLWILFFSYTLIPSGLATVLHFAYPILVTIVSVLTRRETLTKVLVITLVCTFFGVLLVSNPSDQGLDPKGIVLAALSAVIFSGYIFMINDPGLKDLNNTTFVFYTSLIGSVFLLAAILTESSFFSSSDVVWGSFSLTVLLGALTLGITQALGVFSFAQAIKFIGGPMGGTLAAFEPFTAVVIGVVFFAETMSPASIIGCLLILGSTVCLSVSKVNYSKDEGSLQKEQEEASKRQDETRDSV